MPFIRDGKKRGEWVELQFMARAQAHGLSVAKPWGDSSGYDFIVEHDGHFQRVQVKSTSRPSRNGYSCNTTHGRRNLPYTRMDTDWFAILVIPVELWYIVPVGSVSTSSMCLNPQLPRSRYGRYMEAWHLLKARESPAGPECRPSEARKETSRRPRTGVPG